MTTIHNDIPYLDGPQERGSGDLYLPPSSLRGCALLIHGGGWIHYDKRRMGGVAAFLATQGLASFAIDYPLISQQPWPACGDACLAAARFIQQGGLDGGLGLSKVPLLVLGASAGGHLALMTGLRLTGCAAIASIAGVACLRDLLVCRWFAELAPAFFGIGTPTDDMWRAASPLPLVAPGQPPIFLSHDRHDKVVPHAQAEVLARTGREAGLDVDFYSYGGPGHVMWADPDTPQPRFLPAIEQRLLSFLEKHLWEAR